MQRLQGPHAMFDNLLQTHASVENQAEALHVRRTTISSGKKSSYGSTESLMSSTGRTSKPNYGGLLIDIFRFNADNEAENCEVNLYFSALFDEPEKQLVIARKAFNLQYLRSRAGKIMWVQLQNEDGNINLAAKFKVSFFKHQRFPPQKLAEMTNGAIHFKPIDIKHGLMAKQLSL